MPYSLLTPSSVISTIIHRNLPITRPPTLTPLINRFNPRPNTLLILTRSQCIHRNTAPSSTRCSWDMLERAECDGATARVAERRNFLLEEDTQNGDGSTNDGDGGFNSSPNCDVFAVVGEVGLAELDYIDAFYYCADTSSGCC